MIIDGRKLAAEIGERLAPDFARLDRPATLAVVLVGEHPATRSFVSQKERFAAKVGVTLKLFEYEESISQTDLLQEVERLINDQKITGIVVQLPLPQHIDQATILRAIPAGKDVDALGSEPAVDSPVVGAVLEILNHFDIEIIGKQVVVVGRGKLVGEPVARALAREGAEIFLTDNKTKDLKKILIKADIIVSGAGAPGLIKPEMVKTGAVIIDAGTSELGQVLAGDVDPACAGQAKLFTPVPGGVGPVTVALLFKNLLYLANRAN